MMNMIKFYKVRFISSLAMKSLPISSSAAKRKLLNFKEYTNKISITSINRITVLKNALYFRWLL
jgi:hypothetical protein